MALADYLNRTQTVTIETATRDGRLIATPIWAVVIDGACYVRSGYGETAGWYRRLRRTWQAAIVAGSRRYRVRVEPVTDEPTRTLVDDAYQVKYRGLGTALRQAVASPARDYTLRVIPDQESTSTFDRARLETSRGPQAGAPSTLGGVTQRARGIQSHLTGTRTRRPA